MDNSRNLTIDILRGIATVSVLAGHAIQRGLQVGYQEQFLYKLIYAYHMPLFVFLSGYTLYLSNIKTKMISYRHILNKVRRLIWPTILWNYIIWAVRDFPFVGIKPYITFPNDIFEYTKQLLMYPTYVIWFLWTIFWCTMIIWLGRVFLKRNEIVFAFLIYIVLEKMSVSYWGLNFIITYLPWFIMGYTIANYKQELLLKIKYIMLGSGGGYGFSRLFVKDGTVELGNFCLTIFLICLIYYIAQIIKSNVVMTKMMSFFGKYSLNIYLCQCICLNIGYGSGWMRVVTIFVTATLISVALAIMTTKNSILSLVLYGRKVGPNTLENNK